MSTWTTVLLASALSFVLKFIGYLVPPRYLAGKRTSNIVALLPVALLTGLVCVQAFVGDGGRVVIDDSDLANPDVLNTASHEPRHAMQQQAVEDGTTSWWEDWRGVEPTYDNGVTPEEVEAWHDNQGDYTEWDEDPQGYVDQPLEADAFEEERRRAEELTPEELDRLLEASESG